MKTQKSYVNDATKSSCELRMPRLTKIVWNSQPITFYSKNPRLFMIVLIG